MKRRLAIAAALFLSLIAAAVVFVLIQLYGTGKAGEVARDFPSDVLFFTVATNPETLLETAKTLLPTDLQEKLREKLPFDMSDTEAWEGFGIDITEPVGFAGLGGDIDAYVMSLASVDMAVAISKLPGLMTLLGRTGPVEEHVYGHMKRLVLDHETIALFTGERVLVIYGEYLGHVRGAQNHFHGLELIAQRFANLEERDSLSVVPAFKKALAGLGNADVVTYVNTEELRSFLSSELCRIPFVKLAIGDTDGFAITLDETEAGAEIRLRAPLRAEAAVRDMFSSADRAPEVFESLPAPALFGVHVLSRPEKLLEIAALAGGPDPKAAEKIQEKLEALGRFGLDFRKELLDVLSGEIGIMVASIPPSPAEPFADSLLLLGLRDPSRAQALLDGAAALAPRLSKITVHSEEVGTATVHTFSKPAETDNALSFSVSIHEGRLWLMTNEDILSHALEGKEPSLWSDDRASELAEVLKDDSPAVGFLDFRAYLKQYPHTLKRGGEDLRVLVDHYLKPLDRLEWKLNVDDDVLEIEATLFHGTASN